MKKLQDYRSRYDYVIEAHEGLQTYMKECAATFDTLKLVQDTKQAIQALEEIEILIRQQNRLNPRKRDHTYTSDALADFKATYGNFDKFLVDAQNFLKKNKEAIKGIKGLTKQITYMERIARDMAVVDRRMKALQEGLRGFKDG